MHHKPLPDTDDALQKDGVALLKRLSQYNDAIILCGHRHKGSCFPHPFSTDSDRFLLFSIAPTPSLIKRADDALRGFNYICLERVNDKIKNANFSIIKYDGGVKFDNIKEKKYKREGDSWIKTST
jgi:hypothetical protein